MARALDDIANFDCLAVPERLLYALAIPFIGGILEVRHDVRLEVVDGKSGDVYGVKLKDGSRWTETHIYQISCGRKPDLGRNK